jgi:nitroreductase/NAD-dependent dihydropyrimidine dehydrogenase PreA subunit
MALVDKMAPSIDSSKCVKCGECIEVCSGGVYEQIDKNSVPRLVRPAFCVACAHCMLRCPTEAISVPGYSKDKIHKLGRLPEADEVVNLIRSRRSIRSFKDQPVDESLLKCVISLAATAPSTDNSQSTEYTVVQNSETLELIEQYTTEAIEKLVKIMRNIFMRPVVKIMLGKQYGAVAKTLPYFDWVIQEQKAGKHVILHRAPAIIVFHGPITQAAADVCAQLCIQNAIIAMTGMGLGSLYLGTVTISASRDKRLLETLRIPKNHNVFGALAVGYPKTKLTRWAERKEPQIMWL